MSGFISLIWSSFDSVYTWLIDVYGAFDVDFNSLVLGALIISGIIGYILSPYLHNPVPSADKLRSEKAARLARQSKNRKKG